MDVSLNDSFVSQKSELDIEIELCEELLASESPGEFETWDSYSDKLSPNLQFSDDGLDLKPHCAILNFKDRLDSEDKIDTKAETNDREIPSSWYCQGLQEKHKIKLKIDQEAYENHAKILSDLETQARLKFENKLKENDKVIATCSASHLQNANLEAQIKTKQHEGEHANSNQSLTNLGYQIPLKLKGENKSEGNKEIAKNDEENGLSLNSQILQKILLNKMNEEKDEDELSLFAETDGSTLEEYELSTHTSVNSDSHPEKYPIEARNEVDQKKANSVIINQIIVHSSQSPDEYTTEELEEIDDQKVVPFSICASAISPNSVKTAQSPIKHSCSISEKACDQNIRPVALLSPEKCVSEKQDKMESDLKIMTSNLVVVPKKKVDSSQVFVENTSVEQNVGKENQRILSSVVCIPQTVVNNTNFQQSPKENASKVQNEVQIEDNKIVAPQAEATLPANIIENESQDIYDPRWEAVKSLTTNEERYEQVRKCWKSSSVPDPNRNLTYHSFRKRHFQKSKILPKPRKRTATTSIDESRLNPAKRQRSCTYMYDQSIDSLSAKKSKKESEIYYQMQSEVRTLNSIFYQQEQRLQRQYGNNQQHNYNVYAQLHNLRQKCQREIESLQYQYNFRANQCTAGLQQGIRALSDARNEVLHFFSFYKGLNSNDPTILTPSQLVELQEIQDVFSQFDILYH